MVLGIIGALVLAICLLLVVVHNSLVQKKGLALSAWSKIDEQLKRRYELVLQLMETVKEYSAQESGTLERLSDARSRAITVNASAGIAEKSFAETLLSAALQHVFALVISYPELKTNALFVHIQEELTAAEAQIARARQHYNEMAAEYNLVLQQKPCSLLAGINGFAPLELFAFRENSVANAG